MFNNSNSPEISRPPVPDRSNGRWDFLTKPFKSLWAKKDNQVQGDDNFVSNRGRRKFLKGAALVAGAGLAAGGGLLVASESSLQGEDETFKVGDEEVTVSWKEFTPKKQKDLRDVVLVLPGMPGRAKAPALWTLPEQL